MNKQKEIYIEVFPECTFVKNFRKWILKDPRLENLIEPILLAYDTALIETYPYRALEEEERR